MWQGKERALSCETGSARCSSIQGLCDGMLPKAWLSLTYPPLLNVAVLYGGNAAGTYVVPVHPISVPRRLDKIPFRAELSPEGIPKIQGNIPLPGGVVHK